MKTWKEHKLDCIENLYGKAYEQFKSEDAHDDRRLYVNIYEMMVEAIKSLDDEPNNFVCVAMNNKIKEETNVLESIGRHFGRTDYIFRDHAE